jgi:hypothetical protein
VFWACLLGLVMTHVSVAADVAIAADMCGRGLSSGTSISVVDKRSCMRSEQRSNDRPVHAKHAVHLQALGR